MHTNSLIHSSSPYLLQHAHNPVNWQPWSAEALAEATAQNKLIVISIGYSACHWCHVMEKESFENDSVAQLMNAHFINIKIDREEHPDLDHFYMSAVQLMNGQGGWPLNAIALPDGRPVWGGTYLPRNRWMEVLAKVNDLYQREPERVIEYATLLEQGIAESELLPPPPPDPWASSTLLPWMEQVQTRFDTVRGGPNRAPKFPMPGLLSWYLVAGQALGVDPMVQQAHRTLHHMAYSGLNDVIGGGFFRYSVDADWKIPHFEKMLYDNAQLLEVYAQAYRYRKEETYREICLEIAQFFKNDLQSPEKGLYSALDADSEGMEGKYYLFTPEEVQHILQKNALATAAYLGIGTHGLWEHGLSHPQAKMSAETFEKSQNAPGFAQHWPTIKTQLLIARSRRVKPGTDTKQLMAWNAMAISGLAEAYRAFQDPAWKAQAVALGQACTTLFFTPEGEPRHQFSGGRPMLAALADDHAFAIKAFLDLHEITGQWAWYNKARQLTLRTLDQFSAAEGPLFTMAPQQETRARLPQSEVEDNVIPSSNAQMAHNLYLLGLLEGNTTWTDRARAMYLAMAGRIERYPEGYYHWLKLATTWAQPSAEWIITGPDAESIYLEALNNLPPGTLIRWTDQPSELACFKNRFTLGKNAIFVCNEGSCKMPANSLQEALQHLNP
jgi:uncharacterized protein YyaL (SSP411 family)